MSTVIKAGLLFWHGKGWTAEYAEAKTFANWPSLAQVRKATMDAVACGKGTAVSVYRNYGLAAQERFQFVNAVRNEGAAASEY